MFPTRSVGCCPRRHTCGRTAHYGSMTRTASCMRRTATTRGRPRAKADRMDRPRLERHRRMRGTHSFARRSRGSTRGPRRRCGVSEHARPGRRHYRAARIGCTGRAASYNRPEAQSVLISPAHASPKPSLGNRGRSPASSHRRQKCLLGRLSRPCSSLDRLWGCCKR